MMEITVYLRSQLDVCKRLLRDIVNTGNSYQSGYPTAHSGVSVGYLSAEQLKDSLGGQATNAIGHLTDLLRAELQANVTYLQRWKEAHMRAEFGYPLPLEVQQIKLSDLRTKFDEVFEITLELIVGINYVLPHLNSEQSQPLLHLQNNLFHCMTETLKNSLIVVRQPPPVISKLKPISVELNFFMSKLLEHCDVGIGRNLVSAVLLREDEVSQTNFSSELGESKVAEFAASIDDSNNRRLSCIFEQVETGLRYNIPKIVLKQNRRRNQNHATEQQYVLAFQLLVHFKKLPQQYLFIHTLSLPFAIIVQITIQEHAAQMNIAYDYSFSSINVNGTLQKVQDATVEDTMAMLNNLFNKTAGTKRQFSSMNKAALATKLLQYVSWNNYENVKHARIQRSQLLHHGTTNDNKPTFAKWFWDSAKVIKNAKLMACYDGWLIEGFMNKCDAERILKSLKTSCIIARFSDSVPGTIAFMACYYKIDIQQSAVESLGPYEAEKLKNKETYDMLQKKLFSIAQHFYLSIGDENQNRVSYQKFLDLLLEEARRPTARRPHGYIQAEMIETSNVRSVEVALAINQTMQNRVVAPVNIEQQQLQPALGWQGVALESNPHLNVPFDDYVPPPGTHESADASLDSFLASGFYLYEPQASETTHMCLENPSTSQAEYDNVTGSHNLHTGVNDGSLYSNVPNTDNSLENLMQVDMVDDNEMHLLWNEWEKQN